MSSRYSFFSAVGFILLLCSHTASAQKYGFRLPDNAAVQRFDFAKNGIDKWKTVEGKWTVEEIAGTPSGRRALVQRATTNQYNVIIAPDGPYTGVDISVRFKPMSGREDASGGIVFRFSDGKYYLVRANAFEDNFRFYYFDQKRYQLGSATVKPPALGQWHTLRSSPSLISSRPI